MAFLIPLGTSNIEITLDPAVDNTVRLIPKSSIKEIKIASRGNLFLLYHRSETSNVIGEIIDLMDISNQATWSAGTLTSDKAALASFKTWLDTSSGGGGGGGDASASNQLIQNSLLNTISGTGIVSGTSVNSTNTPLAGGEVFTGTSEDISLYGSVTVTVFTDQASATDGLSIQQSSNGTDWDVRDVFTLAAQIAGRAQTFQVQRAARFFRVVYTNGATIQTAFRLQTIFNKTISRGSSVRPQDGRTNEVDVEEFSSFNLSYNRLTNAWDRMELQDRYLTGQATQTAIVNNILTSPSGATPTDVIAYRAFAIQVVSTGTSGTYIFEGSNNGTNFQPIPVFNQALAVPVPIVTAITATVSQIIYVGATMFRYVRLRIATTVAGGSIQAFTTLTQTSFSIGQTVVGQGTAANLNATVSGTINLGTAGVAATSIGKAEDATHTSGDTLVGIAGVRQDTLLTPTSVTNDYGYVALNRHSALLIAGFRTTGRTYSATANITLAANPTDVFSFFGNASSTIQITKIRVTGIQTVTGSVDMQLIRRSAVNTGGTVTNFSAALHEVGDTANASVPILYTANPSALGTALGTIRRWYQPIGTQASGLQGEYTLEFGENGKPIVLSGIAQGLCLNLNAAAVAGGVLNVSIEWIEF